MVLAERARLEEEVMHEKERMAGMQLKSVSDQAVIEELKLQVRCCRSHCRLTYW